MTGVGNRDRKVYIAGDSGYILEGERLLEEDIIGALGGKHKIRETLTGALGVARDQKGILPEHIDEVCCLGEHVPSIKNLLMYCKIVGQRSEEEQREYPSWQLVENRPELLSSYVFSPVSFAVGVSLQEALGEEGCNQLNCLYTGLKGDEVIPYELARGTEGDVHLSKRERFFAYAYLCILNALDE